MSVFPTTEAEIVALAQNMVGGYTAHGTDFPGVVVAELSTALADYLSARNDQEQARAAGKIATEAKNTAMDTLIGLMKDDLKVSEADVSSDPEKLSLIGWGPKAPKTPIVPPGSPTDLKPVYEGIAGEVTLEWTRPADGGPVRNYVVERRTQDSAGIYGNWQIIDFAYEPSISFINQPTGVKIDYRVKASNPAGESAESNTVTVVL